MAFGWSDCFLGVARAAVGLPVAPFPLNTVLLEKNALTLPSGRKTVSANRGAWKRIWGKARKIPNDVR